MSSSDRAATVGPEANVQRPRGLVDSLIAGAGWYYLTSLIVVVAVVFSFDFVKMCGRHPLERRVDVIDSFAAWDGHWYVRIVNERYSYDAGRSSSVAFFPVYPVTAGALHDTTGLRTEWALLLVSHAALLGAFVVFHRYMSDRGPGERGDLPDYCVLALGLVPTTLYFRMAYSESTFLLLAVLAMLGMNRRWPAALIAAVIGLATATRAVGVALLVPFAMHLWQERRSSLGFVVRGGLFLPLACWGLAAWMAYQYVAFDEPLAFVKTQAHWRHRIVVGGVIRTVAALLTLEPLRAVYDPESPCFWGNAPPSGNHLFNARFWTPIVFLGTWASIGLGAWRRWLSGKEVALSIGLLLIPYVTHSYVNCMAGAQRYAAVVFPFYIVVGHLLVRLPSPLAGALMAVSGLFLGLSSALFVAWYWYY